jgi:hypothetical protein
MSRTYRSEEISQGGGGIGDLVCDALPTICVQEGSQLQGPLGKMLGFGERREMGSWGQCVSQFRSNIWGVNLNGLHHLGHKIYRVAGVYVRGH